MKTSPLLLSSALAALALGSFSAAHAWEHIGNAWDDNYVPIEIHTADDGTENTIANCQASGGLSGCCEETVPVGYCLESIQNGFAAWDDAPCAGVQYDVVDTIANPEEAAPNLVTYDPTDFYNHVVYNDPSDVQEAGVLAAVLPQLLPGRTTLVLSEVYGVQAGADMAWNDDVEFTTEEVLDANQCIDEFSMLAVATHEIGHILGLDHSCEDPDDGGAPCLDRELLEATMFWSVGPCQNSTRDINEDDIEGLTVLWGPSARFQCSNELTDGLSVGVVPFSINCTVVSEFLNEVTAATWRWGDGGTDEGLTATHEYTEAGNYNIEVNVQGEREACGPEGWTNNFRRIGYVRACDVPDASFEVNQLDGLRYEFLNTSDVSVYGCLSDIQWDIFRGSDETGERVGEPISAWEPEFEFPEPGTYTIVLSLGGIGGAGGAKVTFDVSRFGGERRGFGCNTGSLPAGGAALGLVMVGLLAARRRR